MTGWSDRLSGLRCAARRASPPACDATRRPSSALTALVLIHSLSASLLLPPHFFFLPFVLGFKQSRPHRRPGHLWPPCVELLARASSLGLPPPSPNPGQAHPRPNRAESPQPPSPTIEALLKLCSTVDPPLRSSSAQINPQNGFMVSSSSSPASSLVDSDAKPPERRAPWSGQP